MHYQFHWLYSESLPAFLFILKFSNRHNNVAKNTVYDKLVTKVNTIDTKIPNANGLVFKTLYDFDKQCLEKKIKDVEENTFKICLS